MKKLFVSIALVVLVAAGCNTQTSTSKDKDKDGKDGKGSKESLSLTIPKSVTVNQDGTAEVKATIDRKGFDDAVTVKFDVDAALGLAVVEEDGKIDKGVKERTFTLKAKPDAKVGKHTITVTASHGEVKTDPKQITVEVKEKAAGSTSKSSPVPDDLKQKRDDLNASVRAKLKEADESLTALRTQVKTADAKVKVDMTKRIDELEKQRKILESDLAEAQTTAATAWADYSARLTRSANELAEGSRKAVDQYKK